MDDDAIEDGTDTMHEKGGSLAIPDSDRLALLGETKGGNGLNGSIRMSSRRPPPRRSQCVKSCQWNLQER
jgi:hypothetical protein